MNVFISSLWENFLWGLIYFDQFNYLTLLTNLSIEANRVDPEQSHPIKNETFFYSSVNLDARLKKSHSKLARLFGYSHVPYSTHYTLPSFVARQH